MRRARTAVIILIGTVVVLAIVTAIALSIDLGRYKPFVEDRVSAALGREFRIDGEFRPTLGSRIRVIAADVQVANAAWSSPSELLTVDRLDVSFNAWSLLRGPVLIESLAIEGVRVNLETSADGRDNWTFSETEAVDSPGASDGPAVMLQLLSVDDLVLSYKAPELRAPLRVALGASSEILAEAQQLSLTATGTVNDTPLSLALVVGSLDSLAALQDVAIEAHGALGEVTFDGDAVLDRVPDARRPTGSLHLRGPNAEYLTEVLGIDAITSGPLDLSASVSPQGSRLEVSVHGAFGEFAVNADGSFVDLQNASDLELRVEAAGPSAGTIGRLLGNRTVPDDPFSIKADMRIAGTQIEFDAIDVQIGATHFDASGHFADFPNPDGALLDLQISGPDFGRFNRLLGLPGKLTGPFELDAKISALPDARAAIDISAAAKDLVFSANGIVVDAPQFDGSTLDLKCHGPDFAIVSAAAGIEDAPHAPFELQFSVQKAGSAVSIRNGLFDLGGDRLRLSGAIGADDPYRDTDVQFDASGSDLARTLRALGVATGTLPPGQWSTAGRVYSEAGGVVVENLRASIGTEHNIVLQAGGRIARHPKWIGSKLRISARGGSAAAVAGAAGVSGVPNLAFDLEGDVERMAGGYRFAGAILRLGDDRLELDGLLGDAPLEQQTDMRFRVAVPDPGRSLANFELPANHVPAGDLAASGRVRVAGGSVSVQDIEARIGEVHLQGSVSAPLPSALDGGAGQADSSWRFENILITLGEGRLVLDGVIDGPPEFDATDFRVDLHIQHLNRLNSLAGWELPDEALTLRGHLLGTTSEMTLREFDAILGDSRIDGRFTLSGGEVPRADILLTADTLDLGKYLPPQQAAEKEPGAAKQDRVIPNRPIPLDALRRFDANVDVRIAELLVGAQSATDIRLAGSLASGELTVSELGLTGRRGGVLSGRLRLVPKGTTAEVLVNISASRQVLGLPAESAAELAALPEYDVDYVLHGSGATTAELAGSLNGFVRVVGGAGRIRARDMRFFTQDFLLQILDTINPFAKTDPYTNVRCLAVLLRATDGVLTGRPAMVMQTDKLKAFAEAKIDLKTEKISLEFNMVPIKGLGISASDLVTPYTKVGGTLANPVFALDPKGVLIEGGAAVATAGISILARRFKERYLSAADACGKAIEDVEQEFTELGRRYRLD